MNSSPTSAHEGVHLLILMHGLWGNVHNVKYMAEQFKKELGDRILVYRSHTNQNSHTYDGVDICGQRLAQEIFKTVDKIEKGCDIENLKGHKHSTNNKSTMKLSWKSSLKGSLSTSSSTTKTEKSIAVESSHNQSPSSADCRRKVTQFSILGYSLGGLIARYAIGMLESEGFFARIKPMYFVTMASPHLGIHHPIESPWSNPFNYLTENGLNRSGKQLHFKDHHIDNKPILLIMSEPTSKFMKGLARFKTRAIYSNTRNDGSVPFWSASISDTDPFANLDALEIQFSPDYSSVIESFEMMDDKAISKRKQERKEKLKNQNLMERTSTRIKQVNWEKAFVYGVVAPVVTPVAVVLGALTISAQYSSSKMRVAKSDLEMRKAWDKNLVTYADAINNEKNDQQVQQSLQNLANQEQNQDQEIALDKIQQLVQQNLSKKDEEINQDQEVNTDSGISTTSIAPNSRDRLTKVEITSTSSSLVIMDHTIKSSAKSVDTENPTPSQSSPSLQQSPLPLLPVIIQVAKNLNQLEWKKNSLYIDTLNAHAAIIIREKHFSSDGGIDAVKHVVDMFKEEGEDE